MAAELPGRIVNFSSMGALSSEVMDGMIERRASSPITSCADSWGTHPNSIQRFSTCAAPASEL
jgi:hypothetical protein